MTDGRLDRGNPNAENPDAGNDGMDIHEAPAGCSCGAAPRIPISGTRAERYQVMLHVEAGTLAEQGEPGRSELEDGTRLSAETSRRIACDASVVRVTRRTCKGADVGAGDGADGGASKSADAGGANGGANGGPHGSVLDVGRRTRTIPPALRRALEIRDRGCRFPGCGLRFTDVHHIKHWAQGGPTSMGNCVLLCKVHHRLVHEDGWQVVWTQADRPMFFDPRGGAHMDARPRTPELADVRAGERPAEALMRANRGRGIDPDWRTAGATWKREEDIPDAVLFRALEGLEKGEP